MVTGVILGTVAGASALAGGAIGARINELKNRYEKGGFKAINFVNMDDGFTKEYNAEIQSVIDTIFLCAKEDGCELNEEFVHEVTSDLLMGSVKEEGDDHYIPGFVCFKHTFTDSPKIRNLKNELTRLFGDAMPGITVKEDGFDREFEVENHKVTPQSVRVNAVFQIIRKTVNELVLLAEVEKMYLDEKLGVEEKEYYQRLMSEKSLEDYKDKIRTTLRDVLVKMRNCKISKDWFQKLTKDQSGANTERNKLIDDILMSGMLDELCEAIFENAEATSHIYRANRAMVESKKSEQYQGALWTVICGPKYAYGRKVEKESDLVGKLKHRYAGKGTWEDANTDIFTGEEGLSKPFIGIEKGAELKKLRAIILENGLRERLDPVSESKLGTLDDMRQIYMTSALAQRNMLSLTGEQHRSALVGGKGAIPISDLTVKLATDNWLMALSMAQNECVKGYILENASENPLEEKWGIPYGNRQKKDKPFTYFLHFTAQKGSDDTGVNRGTVVSLQEMRDYIKQSAVVKERMVGNQKYSTNMRRRNFDLDDHITVEQQGIVLKSSLQEFHNSVIIGRFFRGMGRDYAKLLRTQPNSDELDNMKSELEEKVAFLKENLGENSTYYQSLLDYVNYCTDVKKESDPSLRDGTYNPFWFHELRQKNEAKKRLQSWTDACAATDQLIDKAEKYVVDLPREAKLFVRYCRDQYAALSEKEYEPAKTDIASVNARRKMQRQLAGFTELIYKLLADKKKSVVSEPLPYDLDTIEKLRDLTLENIVLSRQTISSYSRDVFVNSCIATHKRLQKYRSAPYREFIKSNKEMSRFVGKDVHTSAFTSPACLSDLLTCLKSLVREAEIKKEEIPLGVSADIECISAMVKSSLVRDFEGCTSGERELILAAKNDYLQSVISGIVSVNHRDQQEKGADNSNRIKGDAINQDCFTCLESSSSSRPTKLTRPAALKKNVLEDALRLFNQKVHEYQKCGDINVVLNPLAVLVCAASIRDHSSIFDGGIDPAMRELMKDGLTHNKALVDSGLLNKICRAIREAEISRHIDKDAVKDRNHRHLLPVFQEWALKRLRIGVKRSDYFKVSNFKESHEYIKSQISSLSMSHHRDESQPDIIWCANEECYLPKPYQDRDAYRMNVDRFLRESKEHFLDVRASLSDDKKSHQSWESVLIDYGYKKTESSPGQLPVSEKKQSLASLAFAEALCEEINNSSKQERDILLHQHAVHIGRNGYIIMQGDGRYSLREGLKEGLIAGYIEAHPWDSYLELSKEALEKLDKPRASSLGIFTQKSFSASQSQFKPESLRVPSKTGPACH